MKIKLNSDQEIVSTIREGLKRTGGYCPLPQGEHRGDQMYVPGVQESKLQDPGFEGVCHCMLYYKSL